jgi:hypothetical protein
LKVSERFLGVQRFPLPAVAASGGKRYDHGMPIFDFDTPFVIGVGVGN